MSSIPTIEIFVRHAANCKYRDDERSKRCRCRKHLRWTWEGKQYRQSAKTRSWDGAERAKRERELQYEAAQLGRPVADNKPVTVERAIQVFLADKIGAKTGGSTVSKYKLTLSRLQDFFSQQNIYFLSEIKLAHLSMWRENWRSYYDSSFSLRNNQSRIRHFFRYCHNAGFIPDNPAAKLSAIRIKEDDYDVVPFTDKEYRAILDAIPKCDDMASASRDRVRVLIQLQRWSGLSLVDAVCLERREVVKDGNHYRLVTSRRKSGTRINNVIPGWLGKELLLVKGENRQYFFWSGQSTRKSATSVYDKLYRRVFKKAHIIGGGSHRFRHLFAVSLLEAGVDLRVVSKALGQSNLAVTERYYAKWSRKQQVLLARELTKTWGKSLPQGS